MGHSGRDPNRLVHWKLPLAVDAVPERLALYVGHHVRREGILATFDQGVLDLAPPGTAARVEIIP